MPTHYNIDWLIDRYENGDNLKYIYFWGNTSTGNEITKACFSQWYESSFVVKDITYKTSEHWMMAQKALLFNDTESFKKIVESNKPGEAKDLGREVKGFEAELWESRRFDIVVAGNIHKFNQNRELGTFLLNTKDRILVETSPVDTIWGVGLTADSDSIHNLYLWRGTNLLGFALMEARDFLSETGFFEPLKNAYIPQWEAFKEHSPYSLFWRMGEGETYVMKMGEYLEKLSDREKRIYWLYNLPPAEWPVESFR
ncbi:hypothetical protein AMR72_06075 [Flavobacterium psychrophilum]|nr:hypothetical protein AMR72_06075 [Flavobacterium psychrophilum]AOE52124.1 hypothetical protein ALW18_06070 [Flavobacterium psychrophilum]